MFSLSEGKLSHCLSPTLYRHYGRWRSGLERDIVETNDNHLPHPLQFRNPFSLSNCNIKLLLQCCNTLASYNYIYLRRLCYGGVIESVSVTQVWRPFPLAGLFSAGNSGESSGNQFTNMAAVFIYLTLIVDSQKKKNKKYYIAFRIADHASLYFTETLIAPELKKIILKQNYPWQRSRDVVSYNLTGKESSVIWLKTFRFAVKFYNV